jgi:branched-chain amino acid transport system permease protein
MGAQLNTHGRRQLGRRVFVLLTGAALFELTRRHFGRQWGEVQEDIEKEIKRREAIST